MLKKNIIHLEIVNVEFIRNLKNAIDTARVEAKDVFSQEMKVLKKYRKDRNKSNLQKERGMTGYNLFTSEYAKTYNSKVFANFRNTLQLCCVYICVSNIFLNVC